MVSPWRKRSGMEMTCFRRVTSTVVLCLYRSVGRCRRQCEVEVEVEVEIETRGKSKGGKNRGQVVNMVTAIGADVTAELDPEINYTPGRKVAGTWYSVQIGL